MRYQPTAKQKAITSSNITIKIAYTDKSVETKQILHI